MAISIAINNNNFINYLRISFVNSIALYILVAFLLVILNLYLLHLHRRPPYRFMLNLFQHLVISSHKVPNQVWNKEESPDTKE